MNHVRKFTVVPYESSVNESLSDNVQKPVPERVEPVSLVSNKQESVNEKVKKSVGKKKIFNEKIKAVIEIISKLSQINGFNSEGNIRGFSGQFDKETSITDLLVYALSSHKAIKGEAQFISLLLEANIDRDLIINEYLKEKLTNPHTSNRPYSPARNQHLILNTNNSNGDITTEEAELKNNASAKRKLSVEGEVEDNIEGISNKRRKTSYHNWDYEG